MTDRSCAWCDEPIAATKRRDSRFCSKRCRQASHRFHRGMRSAAVAARPRRWAYADPPYPGLAHYYRGHADYAGEVDHRALLQQLRGYDGWALSTSEEALPLVMGLCLELGIQPRVGAWFRGARPSLSHGPRSAWEPVLYVRPRPMPEGSPTSRCDALVAGVAPRLTDPKRVIGAKPAGFIWWLFELLGCQRGDTLDDLFPGSGGVARAWAALQEASREDLSDASPRGIRDASPAARPDVSPEYSRDVSPPGGSDASHKTYMAPAGETP